TRTRSRVGPTLSRTIIGVVTISFGYLGFLADKFAPTAGPQLTDTVGFQDSISRFHSMRAPASNVSRPKRPRAAAESAPGCAFGSPSSLATALGNSSSDTALPS